MVTSKVYGAHNVYAGTVYGVARKGDMGQRLRRVAKRKRPVHVLPVREVDEQRAWAWPTGTGYAWTGA